MEEKCTNCVRICKWLDARDKPEIYRFCTLSAEDVLMSIERMVKSYGFTYLCPEQFACSHGNQLAVTLSPTLSSMQPGSVTLVAQCSSADVGTEMWFRCAVDDEICAVPAAVDELHYMLNEMINDLLKLDMSGSH